MSDDPIEPLIASLHGQGRLRVWSLVITVFGDLVQHRGGRITSARLGRLLGRVGIEQGTVRTAMSRLGQDGWVASERRGRSSLYRLRAEGLDRFAPATARIYAPPREGPVTDWALSLRLNGTQPPEVLLEPADEAAPGADLRVTGRLEALSEAYRAVLTGGGNLDSLSALAGDLAALETAAIGDPLDAAAARMLLIHRWRRIVLRHAELPAELMPADAPLADPRRAVAAAYRRIAPLAERWLDDNSGELGEMPPAAPGFAARFGGLHRA